MTIKLNSLGRWQSLEAGNAIEFMGHYSERRVRLHLNLEAETVFHIEDATGPRFLVTVGAGVGTIEFAVGGKAAVFPADGSGVVQYQTAEGEPTFSRVVDPVIFTKIANRRHRNPELEEMMFRMNQNIERRLAQQAGEIEAAFERRRMEDEIGRAGETVITDAPGAAANAGGGKVRTPKPGSDDSVADAGSEVAGEPEASGEAKP